MAKRFFYVCAGILMLALSYHFGASSAGAQSAGNALVAAQVYGSVSSLQWAFTNNGDEYFTTDGGTTWAFKSNVFTGSGPTAAQQQTWGAVKQRYR